ncbi:MAG: transcriptional regulator, family [Polyangiaceae bacterium]|jgi:transcriptional regulator with XRE-family HTH domain|nr:transcriptional regulator, family [Polyangiaceae bacterium]
MSPHASAVGPLLRSWRTSRGKSQLALAVEAGVSTRHLSFVETGRSSPSRALVLTLAEHLGVPLRDRNELLTAAGYAPVYRQTALDADAMREVKAALTHILAAHEPQPALVVNRRYDVLLANSAAVELLSFYAPHWKGKNNLAYLLTAEDGLRPSVMNYAETAGHLLRRVRAELASSSARDTEDEDLLAHVSLAEAELGAHVPSPSEGFKPGDVLVPVTFERAGERVDLFTTITTLGTPLDITLQELRIETFFPVNERSRAALSRILGGSTS